MTSDADAGAERAAYVWVWLPGAFDPVVAGVLQPTSDVVDDEPVLLFRYARSYLARNEAISLFAPELPLEERVMDPRRARDRVPLAMASCLRDAAPDAWGRRVINLRAADHPGPHRDAVTYLLGSGSNRIGALDFQARPDVYVGRDEDASLDQLLELSDIVEAGEAIPDSLAGAVTHSTSIGGAKPKGVSTSSDEGQFIAKFSSITDVRPVVKAEAASMLLAAQVGLAVAPVSVDTVQGRDVLLVERFDRVRDGVDEQGRSRYRRRALVSMLTVLGVGELGSYYSSYAQIADAIRSGPWTDVPGTLRELYTRLVFNVCVGNNDDHLRNHAAFWDGTSLTLTPAYDLEPCVRNTNPSGQAINITRTARESQLRLCRAVAADFTLTSSEAEAIIDHVVTTIRNGWDDACDAARLTRAQRALLMGREVLNPYIFYDEP